MLVSLALDLSLYFTCGSMKIRFNLHAIDCSMSEKDVLWCIYCVKIAISEAGRKRPHLHKLDFDM